MFVLAYFTCDNTTSRNTAEEGRIVHYATFNVNCMSKMHLTVCGFFHVEACRFSTCSSTIIIIISVFVFILY